MAMVPARSRRRHVFPRKAAGDEPEVPDQFIQPPPPGLLAQPSAAEQQAAEQQAAEQQAAEQQAAEQQAAVEQAQQQAQTRVQTFHSCRARGLGPSQSANYHPIRHPNRPLASYRPIS